MIESIAKVGEVILPESIMKTVEELSKEPVFEDVGTKSANKLRAKREIIEKLDNAGVWRYVLAKSQTVLNITEIGTEVLIVEINTKQSAAHWPPNNTWIVNAIDDELLEKILYTDLRSNRSDPVVPTRKISKDNGNKVKPAKIKAALNSMANALKNTLKDAADILERNIEDISSELWEYIKHNPKKDYILSVTIDNKWPREIPEFRHAILEDLLYRAVTHNGTVSKNSKGTCTVCGQNNTPVYGFALSGAGIKFATHDFTAFVPKNDKKRAVQVTPVCLSCYIKLRAGWLQIVHKEAKYELGGLHYAIIPSTGTKMEDLEEFVENIGKPHNKFAVFSEIAEAEENIEDLETNIDLLIYKKDQAKMEVYLLEQNIPPGTFRRIRKKNGDLSKMLNLQKNTEILPILQAYLRILTAAYSDEKSKTKKLKEFAQIIHALVREQTWPGKKYAYFVKYIEKRAHNEDRGLDFAYLDPLFAYLYFAGGDKLSDNVVETIKNLFPPKTAEFAFWTGVLARHVVEMQRNAGSQPGTEPFRKRIRNVRMNVHQLQRLFTEAFEKAKTYSEMLGEPWITRTNKIVESCAQKAMDLDAATPDEIGFFFAVGYGLYWNVVIPEKKEG